MSDALTPMQSLQEKVKERIHSTFMELLPPDMMTGMVQKALDEYTTRELPALVKELAKAEFAKFIAAEFNKPEWQSRWTAYGKFDSSRLVQMVVKEAAPELVEAMFSGYVQQIVERLRNGSFR